MKFHLEKQDSATQRRGRAGVRGNKRKVCLKRTNFENKGVPCNTYSHEAKVRVTLGCVCVCVCVCQGNAGVCVRVTLVCVSG